MYLLSDSNYLTQYATRIEVQRSATNIELFLHILETSLIKLNLKMTKNDSPPMGQVYLISNLFQF